MLIEVAFMMPSSLGAGFLQLTVRKHTSVIVVATLGKLALRKRLRLYRAKRLTLLPVLEVQ